MFPRAFRIARLAGIDIRLDPSWVLFAGLVVWIFHARFVAMAHGTALAFTMAVSGAVLFFVSVLAHELGHALEARHRGIGVGGITLFFFGGVTEMHLEAERPRDELVIAGVGPYVSLFAAAVFGLIAAYVPALGVPALAPVADVAGVLGWINVALALFNLIPGAPLDGGRVFRALLWWLTRSRMRAIRISARAGQLVAAGLLALAVWSLLVTPTSLAGALVTGAIGVFMWHAARSELRQAETEELLGGRTVADLVTAAPPQLAAGTTLTDASPTIAGSPGFDAFPVAAPDGRIVGAVRLDDVMAIDRHDRATTTTDEVMQPIGDLTVVTPETDLRRLILALQEQPLVAVAHDDEITGLLTVRQVSAALDRLHDLIRGGSTVAAIRRQRRVPAMPDHELHP